MAPSARAPGLRVGDGLLRAEAVQAAIFAEPRPVCAARISARSRDTSCESSRVRPGASPRQNGMPGAAPWASSTRRRGLFSTRRMRQDVVPSRKMSPAMLSTAKSSSTVPMVTPSGSATTRYCAVSGMAPPEVMAVRRAPRRPRTMWLTGVAMQVRAGCVRARSTMPSESISIDLVEIAARPACGTIQARRISWNRSSSAKSSQAQAATICCARMSSGDCAEARCGPARRRGWRAPGRRTRSARRAWWRRGGPWAARPPNGRRGRCAASATAMERGEPIWQTRSTVPISMPSSSEAVATTARNSPPLRRRSASRRRRAREAAVMRQHGVVRRGAPASWCATRSERRRVLTKTSVVRCARIRSATRS